MDTTRTNAATLTICTISLRSGVIKIIPHLQRQQYRPDNDNQRHGQQAAPDLIEYGFGVFAK